MKNVSAVACLALCATSAVAADYGIGVSAKSDDAWIYAPIDITPGFRLEPSIRFSSSRQNSSQVTSGTTSSIQVDSNFKTHQREFALGAFGLTAVTDSLRLYYGARVAYVDYETRSSSTVTSRFLSSTFVDTDESKQSQDGYRVSPTLGFEYLINKRFSIGGEAEWFYLDVDGEATYTSAGSTLASPVKRGQKSNGTDTQLILRYRF